MCKSSIVPGAAELYSAHPDVFLVATCLKYKPVRDVFEAAALETLGFHAKRGNATRKRPASSAGLQSGTGVPPPLPANVWHRVWVAFLARLRTGAHDGLVEEWTVNYGRGRRQQPWHWLVRWGVVRAAALDDPGTLVLGRTAYSPMLPAKVVGVDFMAGVRSMAGAVWSCQVRPSGTKRRQSMRARGGHVALCGEPRWQTQGLSTPRTGWSACRTC